MKYRITVLLCILMLSSCSHTRPKRVINGEAFNGRPAMFKAIRYYGAISSAHNLAWYKRAWYFLAGRPYNTISCSGSLITPAILQTACHCVSTYNVEDRSSLKPPTIDHQWEGIRVVYFGLSNRFGEESFQTSNHVLTERFIVHERCGRLQKGALVYDFGLIQLDSKWIKADRRTPYPWTEIDFAPQFTSEEILSYTNYALKQQLVCLYIGFGYFERDSAVTSNFLRHGWGVLLSHDDCTERTALLGSRQFTFQDTERYFSWVCSQNFSKHEQEPGSGDSGSPVTCDNRQIGVHSGRQHYRDTRGKQYNIIAKAGALMYNLFVNSIDYRRSLINSIYRLKQTFNDPNFKPKPFFFKLENAGIDPA